MYFKDFSSGAMIENIVRRAKKLAIKRLIAGGPRGIRTDDLIASIVQEYKEHEDLPNTTNPDDWAKISGKKGERIVYVRTLVTSTTRIRSAAGPSSGWPPGSTCSPDHPRRGMPGPGAPAEHGRAMSMDPHALLRSPAYLKLLVLAAAVGAPIAAAAYGFLWLLDELPGLGLHRPPERPGLRRRAGVVAAPVAGPRRGVGRPDHPVPPGARRRVAGRRVRGRAGPADRRRAAGRLPGGAGRPQPRCRDRARGAAHRPRRGARRPRGAPGRRGTRPPQTATVIAAAGSFTRHQHPARVAAARRVPADGGLGSGRADDGAGAGAGSASPPASGRSSSWGSTAGPGWGASRSPSPTCPSVGTPTVAEFGWAIVDRARRRRDGGGHPSVAPCCSVPGSSRGRCCSPRWSASPSPGWRSPSPRSPTGARRSCCSPARRRSVPSSSTPPRTRWARCCCCSCARGSPTASR